MLIFENKQLKLIFEQNTASEVIYNLLNTNEQRTNRKRMTPFDCWENEGERKGKE